MGIRLKNYNKTGKGFYKILKYTPLMPLIFIYEKVCFRKTSGYKLPILIALFIFFIINNTLFVTPGTTQDKVYQNYLNWALDTGLNVETTPSYVERVFKNNSSGNNFVTWEQFLAGNSGDGTTTSSSDGGDFTGDYVIKGNDYRAQYLNILHQTRKRVNTPIPAYLLVGKNSMEYGWYPMFRAPKTNLFPDSFGKKLSNGTTISLYNFNENMCRMGARCDTRTDGASIGPMQIITSVWASFGRDGDGDGKIYKYNLADNFSTAAKLMEYHYNRKIIKLLKDEPEDIKMMAVVWAYGIGNFQESNTMMSLAQFKHYAHALDKDKSMQQRIGKAAFEKGHSGVNPLTTEFMAKIGYTQFVGGRVGFEKYVNPKTGEWFNWVVARDMMTSVYGGKYIYKMMMTEAGAVKASSNRTTTNTPTNSNQISIGEAPDTSQNGNGTNVRYYSDLRTNNLPTNRALRYNHRHQNRHLAYRPFNKTSNLLSILKSEKAEASELTEEQKLELMLKDGNIRNSYSPIVEDPAYINMLESNTYNRRVFQPKDFKSYITPKEILDTKGKYGESGWKGTFPIFSQIDGLIYPYIPEEQVNNDSRKPWNFAGWNTNLGEAGCSIYSMSSILIGAGYGDMEIPNYKGRYPTPKDLSDILTVGPVTYPSLNQLGYEYKTIDTVNQKEQMYQDLKRGIPYVVNIQSAYIDGIDKDGNIYQVQHTTMGHFEILTGAYELNGQRVVEVVQSYWSNAGMYQPDQNKMAYTWDSITRNNNLAGPGGGTLAYTITGIKGSKQKPVWFEKDYIQPTAVKNIVGDYVINPLKDYSKEISEPTSANNPNVSFADNKEFNLLTKVTPEQVELTYRKLLQDDNAILSKDKKMIIEIINNTDLMIYMDKKSGLYLKDIQPLQKNGLINENTPVAKVKKSTKPLFAAYRDGKIITMDYKTMKTQLTNK